MDCCALLLSQGNHRVDGARAARGQVARQPLSSAASIVAPALLASLLAASAWAGIQPEPFRIGLFDVTAGQSIQISILNAGGEAGGIAPCYHVWDAAGTLLLEGRRRSAARRPRDAQCNHARETFSKRVTVAEGSDQAARRSHKRASADAASASNRFECRGSNFPRAISAASHSTGVRPRCDHEPGVPSLVSVGTSRRCRATSVALWIVSG